MGRMSDLRVYSPILTKTTRGYKNGSFIGNQILPTVQTVKEGGKIPKWGKEAWTVYDDTRAIGADTRKARPTYFETVNFTVEEHAKAMVIDDREITEAQPLVNLQRLAAKQGAYQLELVKEKKIADSLLDATNYDTANKATLSTAYLDTSSTDVISYISGKMDVVENLIGARPNFIACGNKVFKHFRFHEAITAYLASTERDIVTPEKFKAILGIENIFIGSAKYSTSEPDATTRTYSDIWGNYLLIGYKSTPTGIEASEYEPHLGLIMQKNNHPKTYKYNSLNGKLHYVEPTDIYDVKMTGSDSAFLVTTPINPSNY